MGSKKSGGSASKQQVVDYYATAVYGVCHGPVDAVTGVFINEKLAWSAKDTPGVVTTGPIPIANTELFGGIKDGGGVYGEVFCYLGDSTQLLLPQHAARFDGRTPDNCPAYRGLLTVFFTGPDTTRYIIGSWGGSPYDKAFYWGSNNPVMPGAWIRATRISKGLDARWGKIPPAAVPGASAGYWHGTFDVVRGLKGNGFAWGIQHWQWIGTGPQPAWPTDPDNGLPSPDGGYCVTSQNSDNGDPVFPTCMATNGEDDSGLFPDTNPAHMIYECLTDPDWGMGGPETAIDIPNFNGVAETLYNEGFGLSMLWTKQSSIEDFVNEILDHIQAMLFVHPRTGLWTLRLIRGDYDATTLPIVTPENARVTQIQRKALGETTNEIVVTWTNPVNEKEETATFQDLANIAMQGAIVSDARNYYGVRNSVLATKLAARDLRTASAPLLSVEAELDRRFWDVVPGDVLRLNWPVEGIDDIVVRVGPVDYGKTGSPRISVTLTEDVFALEPAAFTVPPRSSWQDTSQVPRNMAYARIFTLPYPLMANLGLDTDYPGVFAGVMAADIDRSTFSYELTGSVPQPNGSTATENLGTKLPTGHSFLPAVLPAAATSTIVFGSVTGGSGPQVSGFVWIGDGLDGECELAMIDAETDEGAFVLARGVLDTTPRAWPALTPIWFLNPDFDAVDPLERAAGELVTYRMQSRTSLGLLALADAEPESAVLTERPFMPFRPANVKVDGVAFGKKTYADNPSDGVPVTWANRNRTMEDAVVRRWSEADVQVEDGQTTTIRVLAAADRSVLTEHAGLTGTSFTVPLVSFNGESGTIIQVTSERDGFESLQGHEIAVAMPGSGGYGMNYGSHYGGEV